MTESDADNRDSSVTITMSQCQGCLKEFPVNTIQMHLNKKKSCKEEYSQEKLLELKEICKEHRRHKRKASVLYGIFVFAQYFVSPPHCVRRIRLTKKCEHEKIGPQNSDQSSFLK